MAAGERTAGAVESPSPAQSALARLIRDHNDAGRLRVWSLVITFFGDAIVPRGGVVWLGAIQAIMERLGIEAGALRTAMSRLTADGWLIRERDGRKSYYRLAGAGTETFAQASARIYAAGPPAWSGEWTICVLAEEAGAARDARRQQLRDLGFGTLGPTVFLRPETDAAEAAGKALSETSVLTARKASGEDFSALSDQAWPLGHLAAEYEELVAHFQPLARALEDGAAVSPEEAMAARTLLIHDWRRIVLKDPRLPVDLLPDDWPGARARGTVTSLYRTLLPGSEAWLDRADATGTGALPPPDRVFRERFQDDP